MKSLDTFGKVRTLKVHTDQLHQHHIPHYRVDTDLPQFVSAVQRLQQGVHVASGSLVLQTHVACVLP